MLISESLMQRTVNPGLSLLESMSYIDNSSWSPQLVPVVHNTRFNKDLIQLENFVQFAEANSIEDAGYAIACVCESNQVPLSRVGFRINDYSMIIDESLQETVQLMESNGFTVVVSSVSESSFWYQELEHALEMDQEFSTLEESAHMMAYLGENVFEDFSDKAGKTIKGAYKALSDKASSNWDKMKSFARSGIDDTAKKLSALKKKAIELGRKIAKASGETKVFLQRQLSKVQDAIEWCKQKLGQGADYVSDKARKGVKYLKGKGSDAWEGTKDITSSAGSKIKGAGQYVMDKGSALKKKVFN